MPDDVFKPNTDYWRAPHEPSTADRLFKDQPRLVPMAAIWLTAVGMLVILGISISMTGARLERTDEPGGIWRIVMVLVTLAPWLPYGILPLVQRRHLTRPQPFYAYCRWASILTATAGPALLVTTWALGPGNMWGLESSVLFAMVLYCFALALYPYAARRNHVAWLQAQNAPPPA